MVADLLVIISNVAAATVALESLLRAIFFLMGLALVVQSLRVAARRSELGPQSGTWIKPVMGFVTGIAFLGFSSTLSVILGTLFGAGEVVAAEDIFAYGRLLLDPLDASGSREAVAAIVLIIQFIGFLAVARGLLFLNYAASPGGPSTLGPGFTFLVAGALAVNFPVFARALASLANG